ncbi:MAG: TRAP transporter small permease subunit [Enterocloster clostridioformis]
MWMAFLGIIVLYDKDRLITLDMLYVRAPRNVQNIFWFINKIFSLGLGLVMIVAYAGMYKINSTSHFSTMQFLSKAWHFLPMAIAGGFIAVKPSISFWSGLWLKHQRTTAKEGW